MKIGPLVIRWERRSTLANPDSWLVEALGGRPAASGVNVNESTAMRFTAVFAAVRVLAETIASLPLPVYRRLVPRGKERAPEHPLYQVLHDRANDEMTSFTWRETSMGHLCLWGNTYSEIEFGKDGYVRALWPLRPDKTWPEREPRTGKLVYKTILPDGTGAVLPAYRVLHIPGLGFDGLMGYSPVRLAREAIGLGLAAEEFGARFFANDARPGAVLEYPGKLSKEAKDNLRRSWEEMHQGLNKRHRIAILEEGMKLHEIGIPPEDAQFLETRKFQVVEIARIFRVPPHMLADLERSTFSNIEHQSIEFVVHTIRPWLVRWEQVINWKLFTEAERKIYFAEFLVDGLLRGDIESRYRAYAVARQWGWMSANDIRELENMNPVPGGDVYLIPLNMVPAGSGGAETSRAAEQRLWVPSEERALRSANIRRGVSSSYKRVIRETVARILRREKADIMREAEKFFGRRNLDISAFDIWLRDFYREHGEFIEAQMWPIFFALAEAINAASAEEIGMQPGIGPELEEFIRDYVEAYRSRHIGKSITRIRVALERAGPEYGDQLKVLEEEFESWKDRPDEVAQEETIRAGNAVALMTYTLGGITKVRWVAAGSSCPYCRHLDGKVVGTNTAFMKMGEELKPEGVEQPLVPSRNVKHPPAHKGCNCHIVAGL